MWRLNERFLYERSSNSRKGWNAWREFVIGHRAEERSAGALAGEFRRNMAMRMLSTLVETTLLKSYRTKKRSAFKPCRAWAYACGRP